MLKIGRRLLICILEGCLMAAFVLFCVIPFSCRINEEGIQIIGGDFSSPILQAFEVVDSSHLQLTFSEAVKLSSLVVSPRIAGISDSSRISYDEKLSPSLSSAGGEYGRIEADISSSDDKKSFLISLSGETGVGKSYEVYGVVEDEIGNSLTFCLPFSGYNSRIPRMIITELQLKYGKGSQNGNTIYRGEFVEFLALEEGNLAGLVLQSASDGPSKDYEFPAIDVKKGEILLVHLRSVGEGCVNEITDDLDAAEAPHSAEGIRDLWSENTSARLNDKTDVVILRDTVNNQVLDAVMYCSSDTSEWNANTGAFALEAVEAGIYTGTELSNAASSQGVTTLKSLCRVNAGELYQLVMNDVEEEYDFPFISDEGCWVVQGVSPGRL